MEIPIQKEDSAGFERLVAMFGPNRARRRMLIAAPTANAHRLPRNEKAPEMRKIAMNTKRMSKIPPPARPPAIANGIAREKSASPAYHSPPAITHTAKAF